MDIILNKKELVAVLAKIQGITGNSTSIPGTRHVKLESRHAGNGSDDGEVLITATDLEVGYSGRISGTVRTPGVMAIDSRKFFEIAKSFPSEEISVVIHQDRWCEIFNALVEYQIVCGSVDDFPEPPSIKEVTMFNIGPYALSDAIRKNLMVPWDNSDPLNHRHSCHFKFNTLENREKEMFIASTDGRCLGGFGIRFPEETDAYCPKEDEIIPKKRLKELVKFLDDDYTFSDAGIRIGFKNGFMVVEKKNETMSIRMAEGEFPDYERIFSMEGVSSFVADSAKLKHMLKRVSILNEKDYEGAEFIFNTNTLKVVVTNPNIGSASETIPITYTGKPFSLSFNPFLWLSLLAGIEAPMVAGKLTGDQTPCILTGDTDRSFVSAIMMMRS